MPEIGETYQKLVGGLNQSLAKAHAQAPAETQDQIEEGYGQVVQQMGQLLALASPGQEGTCTVLVGGTLMTFTASQDYCQQNGCTWKPKHTKGPSD